MGEFYHERQGPLMPSGSTIAFDRPAVVWSSLDHGEAPSAALGGLTIKHVAAGAPVFHSFAGRTYKVSPGQFLCVPPGSSGSGEIRKGGGRTHGFCLFIPATAAAPELPVILPTACSALGRLLDSHAAAMASPAADRRGIAARVLAGAIAQLEPLLAEVAAQLDGLGMARPRSRFDAYRKLNVARAFLHDVTDRAVPLGELAEVAGMSPFQLLRRFQDGFGETPSVYHRRLRLRLARRAVESGVLDCQAAADSFGFAGGSSFSHAHRRAFGAAPVRTRAGASAA